MDSNSKVRTYGFVFLSILAHLAIAAGVIKYTVKNSEDMKELTEVQVDAATSPSEGDQKAEAPIVDESVQEAQAPAVTAENSPAPQAPAPAPVEEKKAEVAKPIPTPPVVKPSTPAKALPTKSAKATSAPAKATPPPVAVAVPVTNDSGSSTEEAEVSKNEEAQESNSTEESSPVATPVPTEVEKTSVAESETSEKEEASNAKSEELKTSAAPIVEKSEEPKKKAEEEKVYAPAPASPQIEEKPAPTAEAASVEEIPSQESAAEETAPTAAAKKSEDTQPATAPIQNEEVKEAQSPTPVATAAAISNGTSDSTPNPDEVRGIEDLRQMPGNQRPQYDAEDRLQGRHGEVAFMAYVSKEGSLGQFKILKSSGHRQLDAKTLKALKGWKFYPGQEGWVEIPFKWDLKGGPQEIPTGLRRRAQVSQ